MRRLLVIAVVICACRSSARQDKPAPAPSASLDPFDPKTNCVAYRTRARPALEAIAKVVENTDDAKPPQLEDDVRAIDKQRGAIAVAPFEDKALAHQKKTITVLDGLVTSLQGVAALRGEGPKSPELASAPKDLEARKKDLAAQLAGLDTLCAP